MSEPRPVVTFLMGCSKSSLESFELARLNQIANLRKELRDLVDNWVNAEVEARLARMILDERRNQDQTALLFSDPSSESLPRRVAAAGPLLRAGGETVPGHAV